MSFSVSGWRIHIKSSSDNLVDGAIYRMGNNDIKFTYWRKEDMLDINEPLYEMDARMLEFFMREIRREYAHQLLPMGHS